MQLYLLFVRSQTLSDTNLEQINDSYRWWHSYRKNIKHSRVCWPHLPSLCVRSPPAPRTGLWLGSPLPSTLHEARSTACGDHALWSFSYLNTQFTITRRANINNPNSKVSWIPWLTWEFILHYATVELELFGSEPGFLHQSSNICQQRKRSLILPLFRPRLSLRRSHQCALMF